MVHGSALEWLSIIVSAIGLILAIIGVFFPPLALSLRAIAIAVSDRRFVGPPSWEWKSILISGPVVVLIIFTTKLVADLVFSSKGFSLAAITEFYLSIPIIASLLILVLFIGYLSWFSILVLIWCIYIPAHLVVKVSKSISSEADPVAGFGLILALLGFCISLTPFVLYSP